MSDSQAPKIRVLIVDDQKLIRDGLEALLKDFDDIEVIGSAPDAEFALQLCQQNQPDIVLLEIVLQDTDGLEIIAQLNEVSPQTEIIVLTLLADKMPVLAALEAGATSYLLKDISPEELAKAVRETHTGNAILAQGVVQMLIDQSTRPENVGEDLTTREREVLRLLPNGFSNSQIANELSVSPATIRHHVSHILAKLNATSRVEAVAIALRQNLIE